MGNWFVAYEGLNLGQSIFSVHRDIDLIAIQLPCSLSWSYSVDRLFAYKTNTGLIYLGELPNVNLISTP